MEDKDYWFVGAMFVLASLVLLIQKLVFLSKAKKTIGVITGLYHPMTESNPPSLTFEYSYEGRIIKIRSTSSVSRHYYVGRNVTVLYNKNDPLEAYIYSFSNLFGLEGALLIFGLVFIYIPFS